MLPALVIDGEERRPAVGADVETDAVGKELGARVGRELSEAVRGVGQVVEVDAASRRTPGQRLATVRRRHEGDPRSVMDDDVLGADHTGHDGALAGEMGRERLELARQPVEPETPGGDDYENDPEGNEPSLHRRASCESCPLTTTSCSCCGSSTACCSTW